MPKLALKIAYDGTRFHGYARQPTVRTIEERIIDSLIDKNIISDVKKAEIRCGSRTDKRVSALTNVMTFYTDEPAKNVLYLLSSEFDSIFPYGITEVDDNFNPRHAISRSYRYLIPINRFSTSKLKNALSLFIGKHDFSNFARIESHRNPVRTIDRITVNEGDNVVIVEITAQTFLWNQIRRIIEASIKYCKEKITLDQIQQALTHPETPIDFNISPATPLILTNIKYPDLSFFEPEELKQRRNIVESLVEKHLTNLVF
ncbi:MAG: tRNA pseudouridine(38-40) synthase TruA [Candidatus Thermoplasmatota archaeon]|nr:tRNA pseudouridine(38-40) synthase TruA [Candidatus Thermoplasmatota archaeon]